jgi:hypothetical protein
MLKLKLIGYFIKRNWVTILLVAIAVFYLNKIRNELKASVRREHNLKSVLFKATKGIRTIATVNDSLEGLYLIEQDAHAHWKGVAIKGTGKQSEPEPGRLKVTVDTSLACFSLKGFTLTNPSYYEFETEPMPFTLGIKVMDFEKNIYSWTTSSPCVIIDSVDLQVAPDIKGVCKDGFDKGDFFWGGTLVGCGVIIYHLLQ